MCLVDWLAHGSTCIISSLPLRSWVEARKMFMLADWQHRSTCTGWAWLSTTCGSKERLNRECAGSRAGQIWWDWSQILQQNVIGWYHYTSVHYPSSKWVRSLTSLLSCTITVFSSSHDQTRLLAKILRTFMMFSLYWLMDNLIMANFRAHVPSPAALTFSDYFLLS